jgi:hypothetical protein
MGDELGSTCFTIPAGADGSAMLSALSGVAAKACRHFLDDLSFDVGRKQSSLTVQPFVRTRFGITLIAPRLITALNPQRVWAGFLNKSSKRSIYSRLVGTAEKRSLDRIATRFRDSGFEVVVEPNISGGKRASTPDLLVYSRPANELLIIEYKHALSPSNVAETLSRLVDLEQWWNKVENYRQLALDNRYIRDVFSISSSETRVFALLLLRWPIPAPLAPPENIAVIDWPALSTQLTALPTELGDLVHWIQTRPDVPQPLRTERVTYQIISVGGWTFKHPVYSSVPV